MFKNYFAIAFRHFRHNNIFTLINIAGLAIGISASLVIYLIVQHEFDFEKFHKDGDRIYRVVSKIEFPDLTIHNSGVPVPTVDATRAELTGIEAVTHFLTSGAAKTSIPTPGNQSPAIFRKQEAVIYADADYFRIFNYEWLAGSSQTALKDPFQVVLTESRAHLYFSFTNPGEVLGRQVIYDDSITAVVSGIVKDIKAPTDFIFKEFISRPTLVSTGLKQHWSWDEWGSINSSSQMFVKLNKGTTPQQVEKQLTALRDKHRERSKDDNGKDDTQHFLQPLRDMHFNTDYDTFNQRQAHKPTLYGLLAVAFFLLLLGCINFINLTTAQATQRAKEIGVRKTMGSGKWQLVFQFLTETLALTLLATLLSVLINPWLLNIFSDFIPPGISFSSLNQPHVWLFLAALVIVVTMLAGLYPAFILTRFKPVTALKNQAYAGTSHTRKALTRKMLTVTQFVIAQFLIIATLVVSKQVHYSLNKDLGYKKDAIVYFGAERNVFSNTPDNRRFALLQKLKSIPGIEKISLSGNPPASSSTSTTTMKFSKDDRLIETMVEVKYADTNYFDLYKMKLLAGRNLLQSDTTKEYVINETYSKLLGFKKPGDAIGQFISKNFPIPITGVIADFHARSTHEAIKPLAFSSAANYSYTFNIALPPQTGGQLWKHTLSEIEKAYREIYPESDFNYRFYDESIAAFYKSEQDIARLLKWSAGLCIFISCLGLLGLVIFVTNSRTREIGVRKVLGASVVQIVSLLSKDFIILVGAAFLVAVPLAWWAMHQWLQDFQYRTALSWWLFAITGIGMLLIAMLILGVRTIRSAIDNPVSSLRSE